MFPLLESNRYFRDSLQVGKINSSKKEKYMSII